MMETLAKVDMESLPRTMKALPVERGYPVPWFVDWLDGKPEFRAMNPHKYLLALKQSLCWVCGSKLGNSKVFVVGPMCGINRTSAEPPSHPNCARWSAINCPFLSNPMAVRREDGLLNNESLREKSPGVCIVRNPGVTMLWFCRSFEVFNDGKGRPLIQMGTPVGVEWYCQGRLATRDEVQESIDGGLPALEAAARTEAGGIEQLRRYVQRFEKWLPKDGRA
jgi:hypothetical protein